MLNSDTTWLIVANIGLGIAVCVCVTAVAIAVAREIVERLRRRARFPGLDREVRQLLSSMTEDDRLR